MQKEQVDIVMRVAKTMQEYWLLSEYHCLGLPDDETNTLETEDDWKRFETFLNTFDIGEDDSGEEYKDNIDVFDGLFGMDLLEAILREISDRFEENYYYSFVDFLSEAVEASHSSHNDELSVAALKLDLEPYEIHREDLDMDGLIFDDDYSGIVSRNRLLWFINYYASDYYKAQNDIENAHRCYERIAMLDGYGNQMLGYDYLHGIVVDEDPKKALECYVHAPNEYCRVYFLLQGEFMWNPTDISFEDKVALYLELESVKKVYADDAQFCYNYAIAMRDLISKEELDALVKTIKERTGHGEDDDIETVDDIDPYRLFAPGY